LLSPLQDKEIFLMSHPYAGRYTAVMEGPFVVFLIGFRVNRLLAVRKWLLVAKAMGPMVKELHANPSLGFLGAHTSLYRRGIMMTQYWRSFEDLVAYAQSRDAEHLPAWKAFNQRIGSDGTVGIWHETYQIARGQYECIYANMPASVSRRPAGMKPLRGTFETRAHACKLPHQRVMAEAGRFSVGISTCSTISTSALTFRESRSLTPPGGITSVAVQFGLKSKSLGGSIDDRAACAASRWSRLAP
jgi:hypothetical protein